MSRVHVVWDTPAVVLVDAEPGTPVEVVRVEVAQAAAERWRRVSGDLTSWPAGHVEDQWRERWTAWCPIAGVAQDALSGRS